MLKTKPKPKPRTPEELNDQLTAMRLRAEAAERNEARLQIDIEILRSEQDHLVNLIAKHVVEGIAVNIDALGTPDQNAKRYVWLRQGWNDKLRSQVKYRDIYHEVWGLGSPEELDAFVDAELEALKKS